MKTQSDECDRFANNFKAARLALRLTQKEIHERSGVAMPFISSVERGQRNITIPCAERLANAVGVPLYKLLIP